MDATFPTPKTSQTTMAPTTSGPTLSTEEAIDNFATLATITEDQRQAMVAAVEKNEAERQGRWENRADVIYHFFAYRYFDRSVNSLDLLNFSDADIDSFNLTANKTRGLDTWHVCAEYLRKLRAPTPETWTQRRKFIYHVRDFNKTQAPHFRFYLRNLTADDVEYLQSLENYEEKGTWGSAKAKVLTWATSCVAEEVQEEIHVEGSSHVTTDQVEVALWECLDNHRAKFRDEATNTATRHPLAKSENANDMLKSNDFFDRSDANGGSASGSGTSNGGNSNGDGNGDDTSRRTTCA